MAMMTPDLKESYLQSPYPHCPYCGSDDIVGGFIDVAYNQAFQVVSCSNCGEEWSDIYTLTGVEARDEEA